MRPLVTEEERAMIISWAANNKQYIENSTLESIRATIQEDLGITATNHAISVACHVNGIDKYRWKCTKSFAKTTRPVLAPKPVSEPPADLRAIIKLLDAHSAQLSSLKHELTSMKENVIVAGKLIW